MLLQVLNVLKILCVKSFIACDVNTSLVVYRKYGLVSNVSVKHICKWQNLLSHIASGPICYI